MTIANIPPSKVKNDLCSTRQILALFRGQPWGDCWETGRSAYGPFRALRCHLELKLKLKLYDNNNDIDRCNLRYFFTVFSLCSDLSPTRVLKWPWCNDAQVMCNTLGAYRVHHAMCHVAQRRNSAVKFDRSEIAFTLALFHWLKPLMDRVGEGPEFQKNPDDKLQKMPPSKAWKFKPHWDLNLHSCIGGRHLSGKHTC